LGVYIIRRLLLAVVVLIGMSVFTFLISHAVPGDPVSLAAGPHAGPEQIENLRKALGYDKPLPAQYFIYISGLLRGDWGVSISTGRPVAQDLKAFLPATIELAVFALIFAVLLGIPLGILSAVKRNSLLDHGARVVSLIGASIPIFWLGLLLVLLFYKQLKLLPISGRIGTGINPPAGISGFYLLDSVLSLDWIAFRSSLSHIILPAITLGYASMGAFTRMSRSSVLEVLGTDYIRTARAKGLREFFVIYKHALRNAILPIMTLTGLQFANLLGGAVLVETIFSWPGIGSYGVNAIMNLNFPAIMGVTLTVTMIFVIINLITDLCYAIADPRIVFK